MVVAIGLAGLSTPSQATAPAAASVDTKRDSFARVSAQLDCSRPQIMRASGTGASRAECLTDAITPRSNRHAPPAATAPTSVPLCLDQLAALHSRCERWTRAFNDRSPDGSTVHDEPGDVAVSRDGSRLFVATTTRVGAAAPRLTVAGLSTLDGATVWLAHPPTSLSTAAVTATVTPDGSTVIVGATMLYLPYLNARPQQLWLVSGYSTSSGRFLWSATYRLGGSDNILVDLQTSPKGDRIFLTGDSVFTGGGRPSLEWVTIAASSRGRLLWQDTYGGPAGGQNYPVGLAVAPAGDMVYVGGASEHPETTGVHSWDDAVIGYDSRTGKRRWVSITRSGSDQQPVAIAMSPHGDRIFLTGGATYGAATAPVAGILTVTHSARTGARLWAARYLDAAGLSAAPAAIASSPTGDLVYVEATVARRRTVISGTLEPSVLTMTTFALEARNGRGAWTFVYEPEPAYSASPTAMTLRPQGDLVYVAGVISPFSSLTATYPVTMALTAAGKNAWVARYDVRDPASLGVEFGFPSIPVAVIVDAAGRRVYSSLTYFPVSTGALSTECETAHGAGVGQKCDTDGRANLILAYDK